MQRFENHRATKREINLLYEKRERERQRVEKKKKEMSRFNGEENVHQSFPSVFKGSHKSTKGFFVLSFCVVLDIRDLYREIDLNLNTCVPCAVILPLQ